MSDTPQTNINVPRHILEQPMLCAECGLQIRSDQLADECELCGAPRCRACAGAAGGSLTAPYICSACADED